MIDPESCLAAVRARDRRFDGHFYTAVSSTGIYCRPSCPARPAKREHLHFYPSAAAAQQAGYRACRRCRPDAAPGSPEWNLRADVVARAMRLIEEGVLDHSGVEELAGRLGYSSRQLNRQLQAELGAGALALARARRARAARQLLEGTDMAISSCCFAAGFRSLRQFNETIQQLYGTTPQALRAHAPVGERPATAEARDSITLRLALRPPHATLPLLDFLSRRAVPGVEAVTEGTYRRALALPGGVAIAQVRAEDQGAALRASFELERLSHLPLAVAKIRALFDLDADPEAIDAALGADELLAGLVAAVPGRRVPGAVSGSEIAIRAVLGQQISVSGARTLAERLSEDFGREVPIGPGDIRRTFADPELLAGADPAALPLPLARASALVALSGAIASGEIELDAGADREEARRRLLAIKGIGPWSASYIAMRALRDPDAFLPGDLGVRRALLAHGLEAAPGAAERYSHRWRPWRAYALMHLWSTEEPASPAHDARPTAGAAPHPSAG